jgi:hypothetical protein
MSRGKRTLKLKRKGDISLTSLQWNGSMLNVRDDRVRAMAREIADRRGVTMTQVMLDALAKELAALKAEEPLQKRLLMIGARSAAKITDRGRPLDPAEIDDLWTR